MQPILFQLRAFIRTFTQKAHTAIEDYNNALKSRYCYEPHKVYYKIGKCYQIQKDTTKATEFFRKSIELKPSFSVSWESLSSLKGGDLSLAKKAIEVNPKGLSYAFRYFFWFFFFFSIFFLDFWH